MAEHEKIPAQGGEMPPGERAASTGGRGIDTVLGAEPAGNAAQKRNITAALTDDEREKLIDLVDRLIRNPDAVTAKDCIIGNDVRTVQWIAEHTRALLTSPRAAVPAPKGWKLVPIERSYNMRAKALIAFNTTEKKTNDRDDALDAAHRAMLDAAPAAPAAPVEDVAPNVVEAIAEQWDGCMYAAPGIDIDIGEAIRQAATRFAAKQKRRPFASSAQSVAANGAACQGKNCGATDGVSHSPECVAEHEAAVSGAVAADGASTQRCNLGVGCDEAGVCYASAHGDASQCGRAAVSPATADERAAFVSLIGYERPETEGCAVDVWDSHRATWSAAIEFARASQAAAPAEAREPHSDDIAVDAFAAAMKAKMAASRAKGRRGWETCTPSDLSRMLREHVEKGDPRDVANFCMMLHHHGASISGAADAGEGVAPLSDQDIYDKFSFLEGLVNEGTYRKIAETAIEIARAFQGAQGGKGGEA
ncbi:hypothetical protein [Burkholderia gladioli]|uniref:hypothetical protein n=1 Tax=Burkholderia gladioli TaxID=28095 RepID=UPI0016406119|nr:hypothetical protein [Burkholderia gladioli]